MATLPPARRSPMIPEPTTAREEKRGPDGLARKATAEAHARRFGRGFVSVVPASGTDSTCRSAASCSGMIR